MARHRLSTLLLVACLGCPGLLRSERQAATWIEEGPIYETHPLYYDGTLRGVTARIPEIAELGVKTIYLMPIWDHTERPNPPAHWIYVINDYYRISPEFGTEKDLQELVGAVHRHGMRILLDMVTTAAPAKSSVPGKKNWLLVMPLAELQEKAKKLGWELEYRTIAGSRYVFSSDVDPGKYETTGSVLGKLAGMIDGDQVILHCFPWAHWGPAVDRGNPEVIEYFTRVAAFYVKEYNIDGWRVDAPFDNWNRALVAGDHSMLPLMRRMKKAVAAVKPDAILFAEGAFISAPPNLDILKLSLPQDFPADWEPALDEMCEVSYSYYFYHRLATVLRSSLAGDGTATEKLLRALRDELVRQNRPRVRFLETHDTPRVTALAPANNKALATLIVTIPGVPMIQAGQEVGATARFDWGPRTSVNWASGDKELRDFFKKLFAIRSESKALKYGTMEGVGTPGNGLLAYARRYDNERVVVLINPTDKEARAALDFRRAVVMDVLSDEKLVADQAGGLKVAVPAHGSRILAVKGE